MHLGQEPRNLGHSLTRKPKDPECLSDFDGIHARKSHWAGVQIFVCTPLQRDCNECLNRETRYTVEKLLMVAGTAHVGLIDICILV